MPNREPVVSNGGGSEDNEASNAAQQFKPQQVERLLGRPALKNVGMPGVLGGLGANAVGTGQREMDKRRLVVGRLDPTVQVLTQILGFRRAGEYPFPDNSARSVAVFATGPGGPGAEVHVEERPDLPPARLGIGGVHHVAFRTPTDEEHREWRDRIARAGLGVTDVIDRFYFRSIYFREPGRILFEIATDGPGFATDEDPAHLGERLALPPFLEPYRAQIEAGLRPLPTGGKAVRR